MYSLEDIKERSEPDNEITKEHFETLIIKGKSFVLHFWAEWNGYDVDQKKCIEALRKEYPNIDFFEMNIDVQENHEICNIHNVQGPPTIVFYSSGKMYKRVVGLLNESQIKIELQKISST